MTEEDPVRIRRYSPKKEEEDDGLDKPTRLNKIISETRINKDVSELIQGYEEKQPFKGVTALTYDVDGKIRETLVLKDDRVAIKYVKDNKTYITIRNVMDDEICFIKSIPFSSRHLSRHLSTMNITGLGHLALLIDRSFGREIQIYDIDSGELINNLSWIPRVATNSVKIYFIDNYVLIIDDHKVRYWNYTIDKMGNAEFSKSLEDHEILPLNTIYYLLYSKEKIIINNFLARRSTKLKISEERNISKIYLVDEGKIIYTLNEPAEIVYYDVNNDREISRTTCFYVTNDGNSIYGDYILDVFIKNNLCAVVIETHTQSRFVNFYNLDNIGSAIDALLGDDPNYVIKPHGFISDNFIFTREPHNHNMNNELLITNITAKENIYDEDIGKGTLVKGILENGMILVLKKRNKLELLM